jgi:predicted Fe-Mo cluster-binding NifX family protein
MRIGIASEGPDMASRVSDRFGRTPYFIIYDMETGDFEAVDNSSVGGGAGIRAGNLLASKGVEYVITGGGVGPNAHEALSAAGIKVIGNFKGTVSEAIEKFKKGELQVTQNPLDDSKMEHGEHGGARW